MCHVLSQVSYMHHFIRAQQSMIIPFCRCKYLSLERLNDALKLMKLVNIMADLSGWGTCAPYQLVLG